MNSKYILGAIGAVILGVAGVAVPVRAQMTPLCPVGYTCTPIQVSSCPAGYTCTPIAPTSMPVSNSCQVFVTNLGLGDSGAGVMLLKQSLVAEGLYNANESSAVFTEAVKKSVIDFQEKYANQILAPLGLTKGTGYVGPATRTVLNELLTCPAMPAVTHTTTATTPSVSTVVVNVHTPLSTPLPTVTASASPTAQTLQPQGPTAGTPVLSQGTNGTIGFSQNFTYTLTAGHNSLYVSKNPSYAVDMSVTGAAHSSLSRITANPSELAGDTASSYVIPASNPRTFTVSASADNIGGTGVVSAYLQITKLYYSPSSTINSRPDTYIDFGLNNLQTQPAILLSN